MLLQQSVYSNITGTGSQVTPGFPHSQFRLRVASPKVREHGRTTPVAYELASDTNHGLGVVTVTEEDWGGVGVGVLVSITSKFGKSDEGGVAGMGVSGGDKGDECLGNEEVSSSMFPSGSKDETRPIV